MFSNLFPDEESARWKEKYGGDRAENLLNDELLQETLNGLEESYTEALLKVPAKEIDGIVRFRDAVNIVRLVKDHLHEFVENGKLAKRRLDEIEKAKK